mmetsp:Transcript_88312/g.175553  ORF Transcript_88312/g.175553 Transcript_88312/m.175553 type:complete len:110 (+) Transcript_88312:980-1309(+)
MGGSGRSSTKTTTGSFGHFGGCRMQVLWADCLVTTANTHNPSPSLRLPEQLPNLAIQVWCTFESSNSGERAGSVNSRCSHPESHKGVQRLCPSVKSPAPPPFGMRPKLS